MTEDAEKRRYWLMKAEGEPRYVKGINVAFTFEMLEKITEDGKMESWSGVRNYEARNMIRDEIKIGDYAFLYCSNCKFPHIKGVMRICSNSHPDDSAWNSNDPYYDPKSTPQNPRWYSVGVQSEYKLDRPVTLRELKMHKENQLKSMELLNRSRLSISRVKPEEWKFIHELSKQPEPEEIIKARRQEEEKVAKRKRKLNLSDGENKAKSPYSSISENDASLDIIKRSRIKDVRSQKDNAL
ncbi:DUF55 family protein [Schizosaccharomyces pombe]